MELVLERSGLSGVLDPFKKLATIRLRGVVLASGCFFFLCGLDSVAAEPTHPKSLGAGLSLLLGVLARWVAYRLRRQEPSRAAFQTASYLTVASYLLLAAYHHAALSFATYLLSFASVALFEFRWRRAMLLWSAVWLTWLSRYSPESHGLLLPMLGAQAWATCILLVRAEEVKEARDQKAQADLAASERQSREIQEARASLKAAFEEKESLCQQLFHSQKLESVGRLAGGVAHDFNNLLTVVIGNLELLKQSASDPTLSDELIKDAEVAAQRASEVAAQLLAFSRKEVLQVKEIRLQGLISKSLGIISRLLGEDIRLELALEDPDGVIKGDRSRLEQVLLNLVVNARDAMPDGGTLKIGLRNLDSELCLTVEDTGLGMSVETQCHIFEPFFTTKALGKGTGLGLSTVLGIVSMHSGRIEVDSALDRGSRFSIFLPRMKSGQKSEVRHASRLKPGGACSPLLLVEDDPQVRRLTTRILELLGYKVTSASNGEDAMQWLSEDSACELLVTDVVMPGMSGTELARRALEIRPQLSVLFTSGYDDQRLERSQICGPVLPKPFSPAQLQKAIEAALSKALPSVAGKSQLAETC